MHHKNSYQQLCLDHRISTKVLLGSSVVSLGLSSIFDSSIRLYRRVCPAVTYSGPFMLTHYPVWRHRRIYGPLGSDDWRYLDFIMWTYSSALIVFTVPLVVAPSTGNL